MKAVIYKKSTFLFVIAAIAAAVAAAVAITLWLSHRGCDESPAEIEA
jgi:hypothetical protein